MNTMRQLALSLLLLGLAMPVLADVTETQAGTLTTRDGVRMAYEVRGTGEPTLVFVHCWACDREFWREQVDVFATDHRVVTFDLPGHGASGAERSFWTLDGLASDVVQLVDALQLDRFIFVGHSMGGPVSLLAATKLKGRVAGIVCADTLHDLEMKPPEEQFKTWVAAFESDFEGSLAGMIQGTLPGESQVELREWVTERALAADRTAVVELMKSFSSLDLASAAEEAAVPIRCINSALMQSQMPPDSIERNRRHADYEVSLMQDVGHFVQLENPTEFNRLLREGISSIEASSSGLPPSN